MGEGYHSALVLGQEPEDLLQGELGPPGGPVNTRVSESVAIWPSDGKAQNILRGTILK